MNGFLSILGGWVKSFFHFLNNLFTHLSARWQEEQTSRQLFHHSIYWNNVSLRLQEELFFILKNSPYGFLNNMFCSDNINNSGWDVRNNEVIYYYDIYISEPQNDFALEQIRKKLNLKIAQYQGQLIQQFGHEQTALSYPCIYYGMYISSLKQDGVMVRFEVISRLSHSSL